MSTIQQALATSTRRLQDCGIESASLDVELLLGEVLQLSRERLLAGQKDALPEQQAICFQQLLRRRLEGEPVSYICQRAYFYGHELFIAQGVLQPRPETELLVEKALDWLEGKPEATKVADIGTGSGCIAIAFALARPDLQIQAVDISGAALAVAEQNIKRYRLEGRVSLLRGNLLEPLKANQAKLDLIVANLPYVTNQERDDFQPEVTREPAKALLGGEDGLDLIKELLAAAPSVLTERGAVLLEFGSGQKDLLEEFLIKQGIGQAEFYKDFGNRWRACLASRAPGCRSSE